MGEMIVNPGAIEALNGKITNIITVVDSITNVSAGGTKSVSFPTGFDKDNCCAVSVWLDDNGTMYYDTEKSKVYFSGSNIVFVNNTSSALFMRCALMKCTFT